MSLNCPHEDKTASSNASTSSAVHFVASMASNSSSENTALTTAAVTGNPNIDNDLDEVVFVVDSAGIVSQRTVKTGIQDINNIQVLSGLKEGEQVVTGPYDVVSKTLKTKDKVKVVPKNELFVPKK